MAFTSKVAVTYVFEQTPGPKLVLAWYTRAAWEALHDAAPDKQDLDASFDEWEIAAIETECKLMAEGHDVARAMIEPGRFLHWCKQQGRLPDRAARSEFAMEVARQGPPHSAG